MIQNVRNASHWLPCNKNGRALPRRSQRKKVKPSQGAELTATDEAWCLDQYHGYWRTKSFLICQFDPRFNVLYYFFSLGNGQEKTKSKVRCGPTAFQKGWRKPAFWWCTLGYQHTQLCRAETWAAKVSRKPAEWKQQQRKQSKSSEVNNFSQWLCNRCKHFYTFFLFLFY